MMKSDVIVMVYMDCSGCRADGGISLNQLYYLAGPELKLTGMDLH